MVVDRSGDRLESDLLTTDHDRYTEGSLMVLACRHTGMHVFRIRTVNAYRYMDKVIGPHVK